jgi:hypothetical protein
VATETDAARLRVVEARAELQAQLDLLEASARDAVDIPAKVRRSPAKAAALVGGVSFLALKGPQRIFGAARRAVRGPQAAMPKSMLPEEIDKALRSLGSDGDKVRGVLERDFADYVKKATKQRSGVRTLVLLSVARPLLAAGTRAAAKALFTPDQTSLDERLAAVRDRFERRDAPARPDDQAGAVTTAAAGQPRGGPKSTPPGA